MGSKSPSTITQKNELPQAFQPLASSLAGYAQQVAQRPAYPGPTLAGFSPEQQQAMDMTAQRATQGSPVNLAAQANLTQTLQGGYSNPYMDQIANRTAKDVMSQFGGQMARNFGNTGVNEVAARAIGDSVGNLRYQDFNNERQRQMQAAAMAPALANTDYQDMQALMGVGDMRRNYAQSVLDQGQNLWNYPMQQLGVLQGALGSATGGTQTMPNPNQSSPAQNLIGGGMLGYGAASAMGMANPWLGAALGAGAMLGLG